jgi:hypothetical protein
MTALTSISERTCTTDGGEYTSLTLDVVHPPEPAAASVAFPHILAEHLQLNAQAGAVIARRTVLRLQVWELLKSRIALHRELFPTLWAQHHPLSVYLTFENHECEPDDWTNDQLDHWEVRGGRFEATIADKDVDAKYKLLSIPETYMGLDGEQAMREDAAFFNAIQDI